MSKLLAATKIAYGSNNNEGNTESITVNSSPINSNSTREEILDFIMIFLCERVDLQAPVFKGGYVLTKLIPDEARRTEDIYFSISEEGSI